METSQKKVVRSAHALAIWLLVFCSGWFVMLTELVGARVLSPYFGNTIYVWGSVIGIFLLAMAVGYAIGGKVTKRFDSAIVPVTFVAIAGLYVAGTQLGADALCAWLYNLNLDAKWGALAGASVLYGLPMILLGAISPFCVHLATQSRLDVGSRAGTLYALSTIGSFAGCIATSFILIPGYPLWQITIGGGVALASIALLVGLILSDRTVPATVLLLLLCSIAGILGHKNSGKIWHAEKKAYEYGPNANVYSKLPIDEMRSVWMEDEQKAKTEGAKVDESYRKVLLEKDTAYHRITVLQEGTVRELIFGKAGFHYPQSEINLKDLAFPVEEYTRLSFSTMLFNPSPKRVCVIGIGGAIVPRLLERYSPGVQIDAIDVDPVVVDVARDYFYWNPSKNTKVYVQDGRSFLNWVIVTKQPLYDMVFIDAYCDEYIPFHLTTEEFMSIVNRVLKPNGLVAANIFVDADFYGCEARTLQKVFGNATPFVGHASGNVILVSQKGRTKPMSRSEAEAAVKNVHLTPAVRIDYRDILSSLSETQNWSSKGPGLTDVWSPVESLVR